MKTNNIERNKILDESTPIEDSPEKRDPYTHAKIIQEQIAWQKYKNNKLPLVIIRPGVIFGPPVNILSSRIGLSIMGVFLHLGRGNILPLTFKDNCADAIIKAAFVENIEGEVFHITDDNLPTSRQLLKRYKKEVKSIKSVYIPYLVLKFIGSLNEWYSKKYNNHFPPVFTDYKVSSIWKGHKYSNKKAKQLLVWNPPVSMEKGLDQTFNYIKNN